MGNGRDAGDVTSTIGFVLARADRVVRTVAFFTAVCHIVAAGRKGAVRPAGVGFRV